MSSNSQFTVPLGQRQLFLDGHGLARVENLVRTMHQPEKKGAVIRSPGPASDVCGAGDLGPGAAGMEDLVRSARGHPVRGRILGER